jgi:hypothetical protein
MTWAAEAARRPEGLPIDQNLRVRLGSDAIHFAASLRVLAISGERRGKIIAQRQVGLHPLRDLLKVPPLHGLPDPLAVEDHHVRAFLLRESGEDAGVPVADRHAIDSDSGVGVSRGESLRDWQGCQSNQVIDSLGVWAWREKTLAHSNGNRRKRRFMCGAPL